MNNETPTDYYRVVSPCCDGGSLSIEEYELVRETECYVFIKRKGDLYIPKIIKIGKVSRSTPYKPTLEEAYRSFVIRSDRYIKIRQLEIYYRSAAQNKAQSEINKFIQERNKQPIPIVVVDKIYQPLNPDGTYPPTIDKHDGTQV